MDNKILEKTASDYLYLVAVFMRYFVGKEEYKNDKALSSSHLDVLFILDVRDRESMSELAKKIRLSKSHTTLLVNKLVDEKLVARVYGKSDRRRVMIKITDEGKRFIEDVRQRYINAVQARLVILDQQDQMKMHECLRCAKEILSEVEGSLDPELEKNDTDQETEYRKYT